MERWSHVGSVAFETEMTLLCERIREALRPVVPATGCCVAVVGGYGRGEGGVEITPQGERPHNDIDLLVVADDPRLQSVIDQTLAPLSTAAGLMIEASVVSRARLAGGRGLIIWYETAHGHRVLLGDSTLLAQLDGEVAHLRVNDVRDLLINRGTLLVINDLILAQPLQPEGRRTVLRHLAKAVIGYGDALLFFRGGYHWSYLERRARVAQLAGLDAAFRAAYDCAMAFRLRAEYASVASLDLAQRQSEIRALVAPLHLEIERLRLAVPGLTWDEVGAAACRAPAAAGRTWRARARQLRDACWAPPSPFAQCRATWGWRRSGARGRLALAFPGVAYELSGETQRLARHVLGDHVDLRRAYLRAWAQHGDANLSHLLRKLSISLEPTA